MRSILALVLLAACGSSPRDPVADLPDDVSLAPAAAPMAPLARRSADRFNAADAVVYAQVVDIQHRMSTATDDIGSLPHTFVTVDVLRGFAGAETGEHITLRLLGGPDGDLTLAPVGVPRFELGDRFVGLIYANGETACPFVACGEGLLRVDDSGAWTADGQPLSFIEGQPVIGDTEPGQADALLAWVDGQTSDLHLPGAASVDTDRPFDLHTEDGARMPLSFSAPAPDAAPDQRPDWMKELGSDVDADELRCLDANDFDPTLPHGC